MNSKEYSTVQKMITIAPMVLWVMVNFLIFLQTWENGGSGMFVFAQFTLISSSLFLYGKYVFPSFLRDLSLGHAKWGKLFASIAGIFLLGLIAYFILTEGLGIVLEMPARNKNFKMRPMAGWVVIFFIGIILTSSIQLSSYFYNKSLAQAEALSHKLKTELGLLKNQINPHFLFNTLNNIYGLAFLKDGRAETMVAKLSGIMRYMLQEGAKDKVSLQKEKELISQYLELERLKHERELNIDFYHEGIEDSLQFPPMILINFVENCFKHGDIGTNPDGWIRISMVVEDGKLIFTSTNSTQPRIEKILYEQQGIGLTNSRKLLAAYYPEKHELKTLLEAETFTLELKIEL